MRPVAPGGPRQTAPGAHADEAMRSGAISAADLDCFSAASLEVGAFWPKSPAPAAAPTDWPCECSRSLQETTKCIQPGVGTVEVATGPFEPSVDLHPADGVGYLGSLPVVSGAMQHLRVANMLTRSCINSV